MKQLASVALLVWFSAHALVYAQTGMLPMDPQADLPIPGPPAIPADSYILMDYHSGVTLAERDPDRPVPPASITKLMTGYVVYESLARGDIDADDVVTVSKKAWQMQGSRTFIEVGDQIPLETLIRGMVIQSGNDASVALAEHIAGTESAFAGYMNHYAGLLGLENTHYTNATGLPDAEHYTTARDIALLTRALIERFPEHYSRHKEREFEYGGITQKNRNRLLWRDSSVDGVKTGYTEEAGYCLVSSAERQGMRLIAVVLGADSPEARLDHSMALLNYGFRFFETKRLYAASEQIERVRVFKGKGVSELTVGLAEDLWLTFPRGRDQRLQVEATVDDPLIAPLARGAAVGQLRVTLAQEVLAERPMVALSAVERGGFFGNIGDNIQLLFR